MKKYAVYVHISPNNKFYIGKTCNTMNGRWRGGKGYVNSVLFYRAILKYGWNNFQHEIIASNLTAEEASNFEILLIKKLNSNNRNYGYNITSGGEGSKNRRCSDSTKLKISKGNTGKIRSEELKQHQRNIITGRKHSPETKEKIRLGNLNNKNGKRVSVICITTGEVFESAQKGAEKYNLKRAGIINVCRNKAKTAGKINNTPLVWKYYNDRGI